MLTLILYFKYNTLKCTHEFVSTFVVKKEVFKTQRIGIAIYKLAKIKKLKLVLILSSFLPLLVQIRKVFIFYDI